jgi:hypothetical protein
MKINVSYLGCVGDFRRVQALHWVESHGTLVAFKGGHRCVCRRRAMVRTRNGMRALAASLSEEIAKRTQRFPLRSEPVQPLRFGPRRRAGCCFWIASARRQRVGQQ